jgi:classical protein kinase C/novel protein kinase C epsilon type
MLNQLQFKLQVEEQYKLGIEKMAQAYRAEGDKRLRNETDAKRVESDGKIQLLRKAKKRYETLAKFGGGIEEEEGGESLLQCASGRILTSRPRSRRQTQRSAT